MEKSWPQRAYHPAGNTDNDEQTDKMSDSGQISEGKEISYLMPDGNWPARGLCRWPETKLDCVSFTSTSH
jgi:hypothetical protein